MCLIKNQDWRTPLRKGNIRYKVVRISGNKSFRSLFRIKKWRLGLWYVCDAHLGLDDLRDSGGSSHNLGFHVFVTFKDAQAYSTCIYNNNHHAVVQVEVKKHIASGVWDDDHETPNETWQYCKIVKVYNDPRAKKNETHNHADKRKHPRR